MVYPVTQIAARYMYDEIWSTVNPVKFINHPQFGCFSLGIPYKSDDSKGPANGRLLGYWDGFLYVLLTIETPDESRWYSCFFRSPPLPTRKDTVIAVSRMTNMLNMSNEVCCFALQLQCPSGNWILVYFGAWFHWWVWQSLTKSGGNKLQCANWWHSLIGNMRSWIEHQVPYFQPWCR